MLEKYKILIYRSKSKFIVEDSTWKKFGVFVIVWLYPIISFQIMILAVQWRQVFAGNWFGPVPMFAPRAKDAWRMDC